MDKWQIFKTAIKDLLAEEFNHDSIRRKWKVIKKKTDNYVPNNLLLLFKEIEAKNDKEIKILDHGCGGAMTVFFLVLKGYHNVWGIDISDTDLFKLNSKNKAKREKQNVTRNVSRSLCSKTQPWRSGSRARLQRALRALWPR